jgi:hypothetical protein
MGRARWGFQPCLLLDIAIRASAAVFACSSWRLADAVQETFARAGELIFGTVVTQQTDIDHAVVCFDFAQLP